MPRPAFAGRLLLVLLWFVMLVQGCASPAAQRPVKNGAAEVIYAAESGPPPGFWEQHPVLKWGLIATGVLSFAFTVYVLGVLYSLSHMN